ncbi:MAG: LysR family transcriptional regulator [Roseburia sp.]|nr:LysR family transcriptional regulator [Anaeroplasma bactoclasticum]MCM1195717.1 LysR family transcriptional regulator [Roseburia sp.]MCM1556067.1 LysR family transcriptional regulator [Anaeroplasma bactoclasticum]
MITQRLQTLLKVVKTKNYSKAAEELNLTQPAVSLHIKQLEQELDVKLFRRTNHSVELTKEGEIVVKYAIRLNNIYASLQQSLLDNQLNIKRLTIGLTPSAESSIMSRVLAKFSLEKENLHITIISDTIKNLYNKLKNFEIDVAFVDGKIIDDHLNYILLDTDSLVLAVSNHNPLSKKKIISINELKKEKLILRSEESGTTELFETQLQKIGESIHNFEVMMQIDNIAMIKDLVRNNYGVSILAKSTCLRDIERNHFKSVSIENLSMVRELNVVYHKDFSHVDILSEIVNMYQTERNQYT